MFNRIPGSRSLVGGSVTPGCARDGRAARPAVDDAVSVLSFSLLSPVQPMKYLPNQAQVPGCRVRYGVGEAVVRDACARPC